MTTFELSVRFLLPLAVTLMVCRAVGGIAVRFSQPLIVTTLMATPVCNDFYCKNDGSRFNAAAR